MDEYEMDFYHAGDHDQDDPHDHCRDDYRDEGADEDDGDEGEGDEAQDDPGPAEDRYLDSYWEDQFDIGE